MLKHGSLFSGIGGFDLAAEWAGWQNIFHCEWNEFGRKTLEYYWPNAESFEDITKTDFTKYANKIDVLSGGFPCQPYSTAGKRRGKDDERHLWPEMLRAIREIKPKYVVGENVLGIVNWSDGLVFEEVQAEMEAECYQVQSFILPAASVNAPHKRDRVWFVFAKNSVCDGWNGNKWEKESKEWGFRNITTRDNEWLQANDGENRTFANTNGSEQENNKGANVKEEREVRRNEKSDVFGELFSVGNAANTKNKRLQGSKNKRGINKIRKNRNKQLAGLLQPTWQNFPTQASICIGDDGLSSRLDAITFPKWRSESVKAAGNAIVPQIALRIFKTINILEDVL